MEELLLGSGKGIREYGGGPEEMMVKIYDTADAVYLRPDQAEHLMVWLNQWYVERKVDNVAREL